MRHKSPGTSRAAKICCALITTSLRNGVFSDTTSNNAQPIVYPTARLCSVSTFRSFHLVSESRQELGRWRDLHHQSHYHQRIQHGHNPQFDRYRASRNSAYPQDLRHHLPLLYPSACRTITSPASTSVVRTSIRPIARTSPPLETRHFTTTTPRSISATTSAKSPPPHH